jgi:hypothetical protein
VVGYDKLFISGGVIFVAASFTLYKKRHLYTVDKYAQITLMNENVLWTLIDNIDE